MRGVGGRWESWEVWEGGGNHGRYGRDVGIVGDEGKLLIYIICIQGGVVCGM